LDGRNVTEHAFIMRWFDAEQGDRLLLVNLASKPI